MPLAYVFGATFDGIENAHLVSIPISFAASESIPLGDVAMSINSASFFTYSNLFLSSIIDGTVLIITS